MSQLVESLARLYKDNKISDGKLNKLLSDKKITKQEYEYIKRVFPYSDLIMMGQSVYNGIDCLIFNYGVERIYFDIRRRFEVGYSGFDE